MTAPHLTPLFRPGRPARCTGRAPLRAPLPPLCDRASDTAAVQRQMDRLGARRIGLNAGIAHPAPIRRHHPPEARA